MPLTASLLAMASRTLFKLCGFHIGGGALGVSTEVVPEPPGGEAKWEEK